MNWRHHRYSPRLFVIAGLSLATLVGLGGCFRGGWAHGHDPQRMEQRMSWIEEDLSKTLQLRPEQEPAYQALMEEYKDFARRWAAGWHEAGNGLREAVAQQPANPEAISAALKRFLQERPADAELETLIDRGMAFYATLDPDQQESIRARVTSRLDRHR